MTASSAETLIRRLREIHDRDQIRSRNDTWLLQQFVESRNEYAFEELLRRHGPLVWGMCVRQLGLSADADDAFQAVFVLLIQKAAGLRQPEQLAGWLCGTTQKVVQRALKQRLRRASCETSPSDRAEPGQEDSSPRDWLPLFDRALNALPTKYRDVLIVCELQLQSRAEAARLLGLNENTLSSRLARAKQMLRDRLAGTGVALPAGMILTLAVPATLTSATTKLLLAVLSHPGDWVAVLPLTLIPLIQGGSTMMISKWLIGVVLVGIGFGTMTVGQQLTTKADPNQKATAKVPVPEVPNHSSSNKPESDPKGAQKNPNINPHATDAEKSDLTRLLGRWIVKSMVVEPPKDLDNSKESLWNKDFVLTEISIRETETLFFAENGSGLRYNWCHAESFEPRRLDFTRTLEGGSISPSMFGVYQFGKDDSQLTWRLGLNRTFRPTFENDKLPPGTISIQLERQADVKPSVIDPNIHPLLGEWIVKEAVDNGNKLPNYGRIEFDIDRFIVFPQSGHSFRHFLYHLSPGRNPGWIDGWLRKDLDVAAEFKGIYSVKNDLLRLALGDAKDQRPSEFESTAGSEISLIVASRTPNVSPPVPVYGQSNPKIPSPQYRPSETAPAPVLPESLALPEADSYIEVQTKTILLPVQIDPKNRNDVKHLRLWVSKDHGKTFSTTPDVNEKLDDSFRGIPYVFPAEGDYEFALQTVTKNGEASPRTPELRADVKIRFIAPKLPAPQIPTLKARTSEDRLNEIDAIKKENNDLRQHLLDLKRRLELLERSRK